MNILVISNYYPPHYIGGYEIGCQEAVEWLRSRGHQVAVLTSNYHVNQEPDIENNIYRLLKPYATDKTEQSGVFMDFFLIEIHNHRILNKILKIFHPDLVYVWNMSQISISMIFKLQKEKMPLSYFIFDHWLLKWQENPWYSILNRPMIGLKNKLYYLMAYPFLKSTGFFVNSPSLSLERNVQFASQYLKNCSLKVDQNVETSEVIHWGLDIEQYPYRKNIKNPSKLLYVGQIIQHKGVHTIVQALKMLVENHQYSQVTLTIVGGTTVPSYEAYLHDLVSSLNLEDRVEFRGFVLRDSLIPIYQEHDILIFPSIWEEPFGITLLEGMALGLPIVSTNNGGSQEIVQDEFNALIFPSENFSICSQQIARLIGDSDLFNKIRSNARLYVEQKHDLNKTLHKIEKLLCCDLQKLSIKNSSW